MRINYPIAIDNNYAIWRAFANHAWPALYFVDAQGRIRHHHLGEGDYERSERMIQQLLAEAGAVGVPRDLVSVEGRGVEAAADWGNLRSPENYLGNERTENRVNARRRASSAQSMDGFGRLDVEERGHRAEQTQWTHRRSAFTPATCISSWAPRSPEARPISRAHRWKAARRVRTESTSTSKAMAR